MRNKIPLETSKERKLYEYHFIFQKTRTKSKKNKKSSNFLKFFNDKVSLIAIYQPIYKPVFFLEIIHNRIFIFCLRKKSMERNILLSKRHLTR